MPPLGLCGDRVGVNSSCCCCCCCCFEIFTCSSRRYFLWICCCCPAPDDSFRVITPLDGNAVELRIFDANSDIAMVFDTLPPPSSCSANGPLAESVPSNKFSLLVPIGFCLSQFGLIVTAISVCCCGPVGGAPPPPPFGWLFDVVRLIPAIENVCQTGKYVEKPLDNELLTLY